MCKQVHAAASSRTILGKFCRFFPSVKVSQGKSNLSYRFDPPDCRLNNHPEVLRIAHLHTWGTFQNGYLSAFVGICRLPQYPAGFNLNDSDFEASYFS
jgi:hypothetical protein